MSASCQEATYAPQQKSTRYSITPSAISKQRGVAQSDPAPWGKDAPLGRDIERFVTIVITPILSGRTAATRGYDFGEGRMWLTGQLVPDHKTIGDFRKDTRAAICKVCARFIMLCWALDLSPTRQGRGRRDSG